MEIKKDNFPMDAAEQEKKANQNILTGIRYILIAMAFIWVLTLANLFTVDKMLTSIAFLVTGVILMIPTLLSFKIDLSNPKIKYVFLTLICLTSSTVAAILSFHAALMYILPLLFAVQFMRRKVLWITFAINTATMLISSLVSFYYGLCDLNILLESNHTLSWYMELAQGGPLILPYNENPTFIVIFFEVFPRTLIILVFALMIQYVVIQRSEDSLRIAELTWHKDIDLNTRLFNKNKYEEMMNSYYLTVKRVAVIYWDINNLKITNEQYGHAMGDTIIETLCRYLYDYSSDRCRCYRAGGDEFIVMIDNPEIGEAVNMIHSIRTNLEDNRIKTGIEVSCAVGWAEGTGVTIRDVVSKAESNMFADKERYKEAHKR